MIEDWQQFLEPYEQTVAELKLKLRQLRNQYRQRGQHSPIEFVTGRVKPIASIVEKMQRRNIRLDRLEEDMEDIAGVRVMCQFVEDIYLVVELLKQRYPFPASNCGFTRHTISAPSFSSFQATGSTSVREINETSTEIKSTSSGICSSVM